MSPNQVMKPDPGTPPHGSNSRKRPRDSPDSLDQSSVHDTKKRTIRHPGAPPFRPPGADLIFSRFPMSRSIKYNRNLDNLDITGPRGFHHIRRPRTSAPDRSSIIVATAGACPKSGSTCGVYFGDRRPVNSSFSVDDGPAYRHTNQRAEPHAAIAALDAMMPFCQKGGHWGSATSVDKQCRATHVVVKSHSSYVVEAVGGGKQGQSAYMERWMLNGFQTAQRFSIMNIDLWQEILQRLRDLQNLGSVVEFWLVPKAENEEARQLAARTHSRRAAAEDMLSIFRNAYGPFPAAPMDHITDMMLSTSITSHSDHETCFVPEKNPLQITSRFPDSHMDVYQGDLAFLESPGTAIDPNGGRFVHVRCYRQSPVTVRHVSHCDSLIVAVGGACSANGPNKSAVGVYFGPNNPFNLSLAVPTMYRVGEGGEKLLLRHTTHRAELHAVIAALSALIPLIDQRQPAEYAANGWVPTTLKHVVIKIASEYVVDTICEMEAWRHSDFRHACEAGKSHRGCLEHCHLWQKLRQLIEISLRCAVVQFWHVPRDQNLEADTLANVGLGNPPCPSVDAEISLDWLRRIQVDAALKLGEYGFEEAACNIDVY
ncbi:hypothetical protein CKAH01_09818 [Colletotrichum kahawae]|uniref:ribonuclease H n=1 Tax=Colletotrichum kahawae TaxID=34407 RepID=A0AAD9XYS3_COLKA|nr:hypothetical protein CKAH01_09818 [Colletotrichum kahawae]